QLTLATNEWIQIARQVGGDGRWRHDRLTQAAGDEYGAVVIHETERVDQALDRRRLGCTACSALDRGNAVHAHAGALREVLLRQAARDAMVAYQAAECVRV